MIFTYISIILATNQEGQFEKFFINFGYQPKEKSLLGPKSMQNQLEILFPPSIVLEKEDINEVLKDLVNDPIFSDPHLPDAFKNNILTDRIFSALINNEIFSYAARTGNIIQITNASRTSTHSMTCYAQIFSKDMLH